MSDEPKLPIKTEPNPAGTGRPVVSDMQFMEWLMQMAPYLRMGSSLNYAMEKTDLLNSHERTIRKKYTSTDPNDAWFARKIDTYRAHVGELINLVGYKTIEQINQRMVETDGKVGVLSPHETTIWKTMAEKHRAAQPFFVTRVENAEADDSKLGKIIDTLDNTDYDELSRQAEEQVVAIDAPVQNQEQAGAASDVQTQQDPATPPSGSGEPPLQPSP